MVDLGKVLLVAIGTGVSGWVLENALFGKRQSYYFPNLPFMPVYAVGGATIALLEPHVSHLSALERAIVYGGTLTTIEGVAGALERTQGRKSWDYNGSPVDLPHAIAWSFLGILAGNAIRNI